MLHEILFKVISAWQVIVIGLLIMIVLPVVFYFASFDKKPVKIKRTPMKKAPVNDANASASEEDEGDEEDDEE